MPPSSPIRVGIAEDHAGLRERLARQLAYFDTVETVCVSESGDALLADMSVRGRSGGPLSQVVLMDIEMPGTDGIGTTAQARAAWPGIEVLMLTAFEAEDKIFAAVQAGASGYLPKDAGPDAVVRATEKIAAGGAPTSLLVARKLLGYVREQERASAARGASAVRLTPRENEVLGQLVDDTPEVDIAEALGASPHTARSHVKDCTPSWRCTAVHRPSGPRTSRGWSDRGEHTGCTRALG